ncbi:hypothetical protein PPN31119_04345 [Pandoraea pnomenusa]|uniref:Uncharacterized protein n=1 Tax=Pandoraea pnomenusa TaxID=93220 RepID=A0ABY6WU45_9BURK|nr:hypothetical protein PPN31119_04345 [Pandoraea pnomenusa]
MIGIGSHGIDRRPFLKAHPGHTGWRRYDWRSKLRIAQLTHFFPTNFGGRRLATHFGISRRARQAAPAISRSHSRHGPLAGWLRIASGIRRTGIPNLLPASPPPFSLASRPGFSPPACPGRIPPETEAASDKAFFSAIRPGGSARRQMVSEVSAQPAGCRSVPSSREWIAAAASNAAARNRSTAPTPSRIRVTVNCFRGRRLVVGGSLPSRNWRHSTR